MGFHQYLSTSLAAILILISHATIVANSPAGAATLPPEEGIHFIYLGLLFQHLTMAHLVKIYITSYLTIFLLQ